MSGIQWGNQPAGAVLPFVFASYDGSTGASVTMTNFAVGDIKVYKGISMTERASTNGITLLDTDGTDIDSRTGIHGFSIDTSDNTDAGFYSVGSYFLVVVDAVTVDSQTVRFIAGSFRLMPAEAITGTPKVDVGALAGTSGAASNLSSAFTDGATGPVPQLGIIARGTAQAATSTTIQLRTAETFPDGVPIGSIVLAIGSTQGYPQMSYISGYTGSTDTATVSPAWPVTPSGTITYWVFGAPSGAATTSAIAAAVAAQSTVGSTAGTMAGDIATAAAGASPSAIAIAVLDQALSGHTTAGTVGERFSRIPNVAPGATGGLPILGTGTGAINPSGGKIGATIAAGDIATNAITDVAITTAAVAKIQLGLATSSALTTLASTTNSILSIAQQLPNGGALTSLASQSSLTALAVVAAAIQVVTDKLNLTLESDGAGAYRFTGAALANTPGGGGGGTADWTANEKAAIRAILGIPVSGTTPDDPTTGILDTIRDAILLRPTNSEVQDLAEAGADAALAAYDGPTHAEMTTELGQLPTATENADALLARNQKGGQDGPAEQSVSAMLAPDFAMTNGGATITFLNADGTSSGRTKTVTRAQLDAIISVA